MKKIIFVMGIVLLITNLVTAQVKISNTAGTPEPTAMLEVDSYTKGFLPPRLKQTEMEAIVAPATGLMIYNLILNCITFYDGNGWRSVCPVSGNKVGASVLELGAFNGNGNSKNLQLSVTPLVNRKIVVQANYIMEVFRNFNNNSNGQATLGAVELSLNNVNQINPDTKWAAANITGIYPYINQESSMVQFTADLVAGTTYTIRLRLTQESKNGTLNGEVKMSQINYIMY